MFYAFQSKATTKKVWCHIYVHMKNVHFSQTYTELELNVWVIGHTCFCI